MYIHEAWDVATYRESDRPFPNREQTRPETSLYATRNAE
ncbi:hypothetical protein OROMI_026405 [Orobanche minor]